MLVEWVETLRIPPDLQIQEESSVYFQRIKLARSMKASKHSYP